MYRNDDQTAVATQPALPTDSIGSPGFFTGGSPGLQAPTRVRYWWLNQIQEELLAFLTASNVTPVKGTNNQVLTACYDLFGGPNNPSASGYVKLPSGFILQWSSGTLPSGNGDPIYFPLTFPNACYAVVISEEAAAGWESGGQGPYPTIYGASSRAANGFFMSAARITANGPVYQACSYSYMAIGR